MAQRNAIINDLGHRPGEKQLLKDVSKGRAADEIFFENRNLYIRADFMQPDALLVVTITTLAAGEEIFVDFGDTYTFF